MRERTMGMRHGTQRGFTLIELMIVVTVLGILAMIAYPSYSDYIKRGKIAEAASQLGQWRTKMEQYFLDNRTYLDSAGNCGVPAPSGGDIKYFTYTCPTKTASTYTLQAVCTPDVIFPLTLYGSTRIVALECLRKTGSNCSKAPWTC